MGCSSALEGVVTARVAAAVMRSDELVRLGEHAEYFDRAAVQTEVASPTYLAGVWRKDGATVDPARLAWGLRETVMRFPEIEFITSRSQLSSLLRG